MIRASISLLALILLLKRSYFVSGVVDPTAKYVSVQCKEDLLTYCAPGGPGDCPPGFLAQANVPACGFSTLDHYLKTSNIAGTCCYKPGSSPKIDVDQSAQTRVVGDQPEIQARQLSAAPSQTQAVSLQAVGGYPVYSNYPAGSYGAGVPPYGGGPPGYGAPSGYGAPPYGGAPGYGGGYPAPPPYGGAGYGGYGYGTTTEPSTTTRVIESNIYAIPVYAQLPNYINYTTTTFNFSDNSNNPFIPYPPPYGAPPYPPKRYRSKYGRAPRPPRELYDAPPDPYAPVPPGAGVPPPGLGYGGALPYQPDPTLAGYNPIYSDQVPPYPSLTAYEPVNPPPVPPSPYYPTPAFQPPPLGTALGSPGYPPGGFAPPPGGSPYGASPYAPPYQPPANYGLPPGLPASPYQPPVGYGPPPPPAYNPADAYVASNPYNAVPSLGGGLASASYPAGGPAAGWSPPVNAGGYDDDPGLNLAPDPYAASPADDYDRPYAANPGTPAPAPLTTTTTAAPTSRAVSSRDIYDQLQRLGQQLGLYQPDQNGQLFQPPQLVTPVPVVTATVPFGPGTPLTNSLRALLAQLKNAGGVPQDTLDRVQSALNQALATNGWSPTLIRALQDVIADVRSMPELGRSIMDTVSAIQLLLDNLGGTPQAKSSYRPPPPFRVPIIELPTLAAQFLVYLKALQASRVVPANILTNLGSYIGTFEMAPLLSPRSVSFVMPLLNRVASTPGLDPDLRLSTSNLQNALTAYTAYSRNPDTVYLIRTLYQLSLMNPNLDPKVSDGLSAVVAQTTGRGPLSLGGYISEALREALRYIIQSFGTPLMQVILAKIVRCRVSPGTCNFETASITQDAAYASAGYDSYTPPQPPPPRPLPQPPNPAYQNKYYDSSYRPDPYANSRRPAAALYDRLQQKPQAQYRPPPNGQYLNDGYGTVGNYNADAPYSTLDEIRLSITLPVNSRQPINRRVPPQELYPPPSYGQIAPPAAGQRPPAQAPAQAPSYSPTNPPPTAPPYNPPTRSPPHREPPPPNPSDSDYGASSGDQSVFDVIKNRPPDYACSPSPNPSDPPCPAAGSESYKKPPPALQDQYESPSPDQGYAAQEFDDRPPSKPSKAVLGFVRPRPDHPPSYDTDHAGPEDSDERPLKQQKYVKLSSYYAKPEKAYENRPRPHKYAIYAQPVFVSVPRPKPPPIPVYGEPVVGRPIIPPPPPVPVVGEPVYGRPPYAPPPYIHPPIPVIGEAVRPLPPQPIITPVFGEPVKQVPSITPVFGEAVKQLPTITPVYGQPVVPQPQPVYGEPVRPLPQPVLGQPVFPQPTPVLGQKVTQDNFPATSVYGQSVSQNYPATPVFGQLVSSNQSATPVFGQQVGAMTEAVPVYGQPVSSNQSATAVYGQQVASMNPAQPVYGQPVSSNQSAWPVYGQQVAGTYSAVPVYGQPVCKENCNNITNAYAIYGQEVRPQGVSPSYPSAPVMGQSVVQNSAAFSVYGQPVCRENCGNITQAYSVLGQPVRIPDPYPGLPVAPVMGQAVSPNLAASAVYGQPVCANGNCANLTDAYPVFGQPIRNGNLAAQVMGQPVSQYGPSGNPASAVFGQPVCANGNCANLTDAYPVFGQPIRNGNLAAQVMGQPVSQYGPSGNPASAVFGQPVCANGNCANLTDAYPVFGQPLRTGNVAAQVMGQPVSQNGPPGNPASAVFGQQVGNQYGAFSVYGQPVCRENCSGIGQAYPVAGQPIRNEYSGYPAAPVVGQPLNQGFPNYFGGAAPLYGQPVAGVYPNQTGQYSPYFFDWQSAFGQNRPYAPAFPLYGQPIKGPGFPVSPVYDQSVKPNYPGDSYGHSASPGYDDQSVKPSYPTTATEYALSSASPYRTTVTSSGQPVTESTSAATVTTIPTTAVSATTTAPSTQPVTTTTATTKPTSAAPKVIVETTAQWVESDDSSGSDNPEKRILLSAGMKRPNSSTVFVPMSSYYLPIYVNQRNNSTPSPDSVPPSDSAALFIPPRRPPYTGSGDYSSAPVRQRGNGATDNFGPKTGQLGRRPNKNVPQSLRPPLDFNGLSNYYDRLQVVSPAQPITTPDPDNFDAIFDLPVSAEAPSTTSTPTTKAYGIELRNLNRAQNPLQLSSSNKSSQKSSMSLTWM